MVLVAFSISLKALPVKERVYTIHQLLSKTAKDMSAISRALLHPWGDGPGTSWYYSPLSCQNQASWGGLSVFLAAQDMLYTEFSQSETHILKKTPDKAEAAPLSLLRTADFLTPRNKKNVVHQEENKLSMGCKVNLLKLWLASQNPYLIVCG